MKMSLLKTLARILEGTPVGRISMYAGSAAPAGWLLCQGQAVSRTRYPKLFEVIGTTYGSGDGSTTFNLPDMRGRSPLGAGTTQANNETYWGNDVTNIIGEPTNFTLGETGGETKHTLNESQMPSHNHSSVSENYGLQVFQPLSFGSSVGAFYDTTGHNTGNRGGGQAHNNLSPYSVINFIIYVGGGTA